MDKKKAFTREQAQELYKDLQKAMKVLRAREASKAGLPPTPKAPEIGLLERPEVHLQQNAQEMNIPASSRFRARYDSGTLGAIAFVILFMGLKVLVSVLESAGVMGVNIAQASVAPYVNGMSKPLAALGFTREELRVLTALDERRGQLEEKGNRLDQRESELDTRDREFAVRLTELRELTSKLQVEREKDLKKHNAQLDQLANVYGSMNPPDAAVLIEQLDVTIALALIERMPEKRIGQILGLMSPQRALQITRMLSDRGTGGRF